MERTLIFFKPDCLKKRKVGAALARFEDAGFDVAACKMLRLTQKILDEHYAHITHLPNYPKICEFMLSGPIIAMILQGENVIERARALIGPTDSAKAPKGTIRGDWGFNSMQNLIHASDSPQSAEIEIKRFFAKEEIFNLPHK